MDDYYNEKQKPHCESDQYYTVIEWVRGQQLFSLTGGLNCWLKPKAE